MSSLRKQPEWFRWRKRLRLVCNREVRVQCTLVPPRIALYTGLNKFVSIQLNFPSVGQGIDRRQAFGRISQLHTAQKPTPAILPTSTESLHPRYPSLAPFSAHPISPRGCISVSTHRWASIQSRPTSPPDGHLFPYNGSHPQNCLKGFDRPNRRPSAALAGPAPIILPCRPSRAETQLPKLHDQMTDLNR
jgi:hypothetical protein